MRVLQPAKLGALAAVDADLVRVEQDPVLLPGIVSTLRLSSGTQKLWITSAVVATRLIRVSTGMCISPAVTAFVPGYRNSHYH